MKWIQETLTLLLQHIWEMLYMKYILENPIKINEYRENIKKIDNTNCISKKQFYGMIKGEEYGTD